MFGLKRKKILSSNLYKSPMRSMIIHPYFIDEKSRLRRERYLVEELVFVSIGVCFLGS